MQEPEEAIKHESEQERQITLRNSSLDFPLDAAQLGQEDGEYVLPSLVIGRDEVWDEETQSVQHYDNNFSVGYDKQNDRYFVSHQNASLPRLREHLMYPDDTTNLLSLPFDFPNELGTKITMGRSGFTLEIPGKEAIVLSSDNLLIKGFSGLMNPYVSRKHLTLEVTETGLRYTDHSSNGTHVIGNISTDETTPYQQDVSSSNRELQAQISVRQGAAEQRREGKEKSEDYLLRNEQLGLFGVFDGVGGRAHGDLASQTASEVIEQELSNRLVSNEDPLAVKDKIISALSIASESVRNHAQGGLTTATVVKLINYNDKKYAVWASIGDSPLMLFNRTHSTLQRISKDEILSPEQANVITNAVGEPSMQVNQTGFFEVSQGDELLICSDGITGDFDPDILSDQEIINAFNRSSDPQMIADGLIEISRKKDDKAVVVLAI